MISKETVNFIIQICITVLVVNFPVIILEWKQEWMIVYEVMPKSTITIFGKIVFYSWFILMFMSVFELVKKINFIK